MNKERMLNLLVEEELQLLTAALRKQGANEFFLKSVLFQE
jgi:hypothetical protein